LNSQYTQYEDDERTRLSNVANFADDFHLFAQQYSLVDADSQNTLLSVQMQNQLMPTDVTIAATNDDDTSGTVSLTTVPFTITVYTLSLDPGQTVTMFSSATGNQRLAYLQFTDTVWAKWFGS
jgi:hypothetical protein